MAPTAFLRLLLDEGCLQEAQELAIGIVAGAGHSLAESATLYASGHKTPLTNWLPYTQVRPLGPGSADRSSLVPRGGEGCSCRVGRRPLCAREGGMAMGKRRRAKRVTCPLTPVDTARRLTGWTKR